MRRGLTLLEVLLTALIALVLLGLTAQGIMRGSEITRLVTTQQELLEDVRTAGAFLSDRFARAAYVYPPGTTITLGTANDYWARKPKSSSNNWQIGSDPMVAFILPPENPAVAKQCLTNLASDPDGCLRFVAFFMLERSHVLANAPASVRPDTNEQSNSDWVLYYFSCPMIDAACGNGPWNAVPDSKSVKLLPTQFAGSSAQFVADYINPAAFSLSFGCAMDSNRVTLNATCNSGSLKSIDTAATVELTLQSRINRGGRTTLVPNPHLTIRASARNLVLP
jgi:hypothetical protein